MNNFPFVGGIPELLLDISSDKVVVILEAYEASLKVNCGVANKKVFPILQSTSPALTYITLAS